MENTNEPGWQLRSELKIKKSKLKTGNLTDIGFPENMAKKGVTFLLFTFDFLILV
jgi:hypothetical protein